MIRKGRSSAPRARRFAAVSLTARADLRQVVLAALVLPVVAMIITALFQPFSLAQEYSFEVPREEVKVKIEKDSSLTINYRITFKNTSPTTPIDIVDIGMPTQGYLLDSCYAYVDGEAAVEIKPSEVVSPGVEVHLKEKSIRPGEEKVFEFSGKVERMVFQDTQRNGYASVRFKNTWWSPSYARGTTHLEISIQFPPEVKPNETIYHDEQPQKMEPTGDGIVFTWVHPDALPTKGYIHGVSFPAVYVSGVYPEQPLPEYTPPQAPGTYEGMSTVRGMVIIYNAGIAIMIIVRLFFSYRAIKRKGVKARYIKPEVSVEGAGPMKELAPPEFALLDAQDFDRIAALLVFNLAAEGLLTVVGTKPLRVLKKDSAVPCALGEPPEREIPSCYIGFLNAVSSDGEFVPGKLREALTMLIRVTELKVRGFSQGETVAYYRRLIADAWVRVKMEADRSERLSAFKENLPWLLCDPAFTEKVKELFSRGTYPAEDWISNLVPGDALSADTGLAEALGKGALSGDELAGILSGAFIVFQDSFYSRVQDLEAGILKEVYPDEYRRFFVRRWHAPSGYGGGGSCACACACAGCACACAGGGR